jgi:hypothetical protein
LELSHHPLPSNRLNQDGEAVVFRQAFNIIGKLLSRLTGLLIMSSSTNYVIFYITIIPRHSGKQLQGIVMITGIVARG